MEIFSKEEGFSLYEKTVLSVLGKTRYIENLYSNSKPFPCLYPIHSPKYIFSD